MVANECDVGQRGRRHAHPEEADGEQVEDLGVAERRDRSRCEQRGDHEVEVGGQLDDAAPSDDTARGSDDLEQARDAASQAHPERRHAPEDRRQLGEELQDRTDECSECDGAGEVELRASQRSRHAEEDDDGRVPQHRCDVGAEEAPMCVEHTERPGAEHEEPERGGDDAHERDGQLGLRGAHGEAWGQHPGDRSGEHDADDDEQTGDQDEKGGHRTGETSGVLLTAVADHPCVRGHERA